MDIVSKVFLASIYALILPLRLWHTLRGYDRMHLSRSGDTGSYWIPRKQAPDLQSYFLESSLAEGRCPGANESVCIYRGGARWITPLLRLLAKAYAPARSIPSGRFSTADREQGIPDEIYTLW